MRMAEGRWEGAGEDRMAGGWWVVGGGLWWVLWRVGNVVLESCERAQAVAREELWRAADWGGGMDGLPSDDWWSAVAVDTGVAFACWCKVRLCCCGSVSGRG